MLADRQRECGDEALAVLLDPQSISDDRPRVIGPRGNNAVRVRDGVAPEIMGKLHSWKLDSLAQEGHSWDSDQPGAPS